MALIIETGTGAATSQAYATAATFDAWLLLTFGETLTQTTAQKEAGILRAVAAMNAFDWIGTKTYGRVQALSWPRADAYDRDGHAIASNTIPVEVIEAQHILARAEIATPGTLAPSVTLAGGKTLVAVDSLQWETRKAPVTVDASRPVLTMAMDRLKGLVRSGGTLFLERA